MFSLQQTVNFAKTYTQYYPLSVGSNNGEMAISTASMIRASILGAPMTYAWNRATATQAVVAGTQDYTISLTDFGFLEKATLTDDAGTVTEMPSVYNREPLSVNTGGTSRPNAISVILLTPYVSATFRFLSVPQKNYTLTLTYQKIAQPFTLGGDISTMYWDSIPDFYKDVYNNLFLAEAMALVEDPRASIYRIRGVSALFTKMQGLSDTQKNIFAQQWLANDAEMAAAGLTLQEGTQSRQI